MTKQRLLPIFYLIGTVIFWGTSFTATKGAYAMLPPMAVIWLRMVVASAVFLPFWHRLPRPDYRPGDWKLLAASMAFIPSAYFTLEGFAMVFTTSSQAGVVSAIAPLIVAVGAWLFLRERLSWQQGLGIAVSIAMVAVLAFGGTTQESAPAPWLGNLLELAAMVTAAGSTITIKLLSSRYHPWFLAGLQAATGAVFFAPLALLGEPIHWAALPTETWLQLAYLGVFPGLVAFGLYNSALRLLPAASAAMAINAIPAVAVLAGWLALGESLTLLQLIACAAIIAAVAFAEWASSGNHAAASADSADPPIVEPELATLDHNDGGQAGAFRT
ncbi:EamA family transporter [Propionicimonas sp.]|uniref:DMT family transporter n=1 Tax=Propionicimonas sp. TaxID=1955623 RepID=UPI00183A9C31|nr:EamA family transporter [Propionicimonas sp.]MBU3977864.1 EamA family transporter [Actinomycetota bacterium]MBA3021913.1 EamA family transporter [Propionicimonas sp.]MBU3987641.1 EamA family transporter [Actinomycetota bacterium]MBU4007363.1 EamA family transporter [Actinomycetota bacterium]MBU4065691.1 EamA family transporter [Actinomycetota bacterium]